MSETIEIKKDDLVRFKGGKYVVTTPKKRVEYELEGVVGKVESLPIIDGGAYLVDVVLDGEHRKVMSSRSDLEFFGSECVKDHFAITPDQYFENLRKCIDDIIVRNLFDVPKLDGFSFAMQPGCVGGERRSDKEHKMSKSKCIELLQRYRAEREKEGNGRRFELCLRKSVVNEALERAIELLKEGNE